MIFVRAEPGEPRLLVERRRVGHRLAPAIGGMDVDFDHAGIGRHLDDIEPRVRRRRIALDADGRVARLGDGLHRGEDLQIILKPLGRRHEHAQEAVAHLDGERRAHRPSSEKNCSLCALEAAVGLAEVGGRRQRVARDDRIERIGVGIGARRHVGQALDRQAQPQRRVAGDHVELAAPQRPAFAAPRAAGGRVPALDRQHEARRLAEAAVEHAPQARALLGVFELGIERDRH